MPEFKSELTEWRNKLDFNNSDIPLANNSYQLDYVVFSEHDYYVIEKNIFKDDEGNETLCFNSYYALKEMRRILVLQDNYKYWQPIPTQDSLYYIDVRKMTGVATSSTNIIVIPLNSGNLSISTLTTQIATDLKNDINSCRESFIFDPNDCIVSVSNYTELTSAISSATAGQTIRIISSFTTISSIVLKDGVNLYVNEGVTLTIETNENLFSDGNVQCICSILGFGKFEFKDKTSSKNIINTNCETTNIWLDFREILYLGIFAPFYSQISHGGSYRVKGQTLNSNFRLFDSDGDVSVISLDVVTVITNYEFMYPATSSLSSRMYLKNMFVISSEFGSLEGLGGSVEINWIGVFHKNNSLHFDVSSCQSLLTIRLFYSYIDSTDYIIISGDGSHKIIGYNSIVNQGNDPYYQITEIDYRIDLSFTINNIP